MASDGELCCESAWKNNNGILGLLTADSWMRWKFLCGEDFQGDDYHRPSKQYPGHGQNFRVLPGVSWWTRWVFTDISIKHFIPADDGCWVSLNPWEFSDFIHWLAELLSVQKLWTCALPCAEFCQDFFNDFIPLSWRLYPSLSCVMKADTVCSLRGVFFFVPCYSSCSGPERTSATSTRSGVDSIVVFWTGNTKSHSSCRRSSFGTW